MHSLQLSRNHPKSRELLVSGKPWVSLARLPIFHLPRAVMDFNQVSQNQGGYAKGELIFI